jgi:MFS family permease
VLCGVLYLDGLDVSLAGVTLPSIQRDLGLNASQLQWIVSAYVLGYGGLLLLGGRAADLYGRRRVLLTGLAVFGAVSLLSGLTSTAGVLIAARFVKGAAAAFTAPAGLSIVTTTFPAGPARNRAMAVYAAVGATGFSSGLIIGGLLTEASWRWAFTIAAPVALVLLVTGWRVVPRDAAPPAAARRLDAGGAVTLTAAMLAVVWSVVQVPSHGWRSATTLAGFAVALAAASAFAAIELRHPHPLVRLGIFRTAPLARAMIGAFTLFGAYVAYQFVLTLYLQTTHQWSPLRTALAFLPLGVGIAVSASRAGGFLHRTGTQQMIAAGFAVMTAGYLIAWHLASTPHYTTTLLPAMVLIGTGIGMCFPALNLQATHSLPENEQGAGAAILQSSLQLGGAVMVSTAAAVIGSPDRTDVLTAYRSALSLVTGIAVLGLVLAVLFAFITFTTNKED